MYFKGDIIITDPGYFIRDDRLDIPDEVMKSEPQAKDFMRYKSKSQYPDCRRKAESELNELEKAQYKQLKKQIEEMKLNKENQDDAEALNYFLPTISEMYDADITAYIKAYKEWEMPYLSDWEKTNCGEDLSVLGFKNWISSTTYYGDWSCGVFSSGKCIGKFCADGGMVCVTTLEEILKYDPDFNLYETHPHACAIIRNFDGDISFKIKEKANDTILQIIGKGNIKFKTAQIGL